MNLTACLPQLTQEQQQRLLTEWNATVVDYPQHQCIHHLFEAQADQTPEAIAVVQPAIASANGQVQQFTYQELNSRANQLAHHLQQLGVAPDKLVAVCLPRSLDLTIAILGILKAGAAYVPLDPAYPNERLAFMLADTQAEIILTHSALMENLPDHQAQVICLDTDWAAIVHHPGSNPTSPVSPDNLTYVIYTSGSTGKPKGVMLGHRALVNLIYWQLESSVLSPGAKTLQFAALSFDVSFQELFSTWCAGGTLVLISEELRRDAASLLRLIEQESVQRLFLPFIALQHLAEAADTYNIFPPSLREVITAGEQLQVNRYIVNLFSRLEHCTLENQYGPSESHVVTVFKLTGATDEWTALPPIGRPIANTQIHLLDDQLQPVPIGSEGELYISGICLARGYLNRPELTAERFIPNPQSPTPNPSRLYKTGDIARYLPDGAIEYLGRSDGQVKIRGFRIELGEIETALTTHPAIKQAVVMAREDQAGNKKLVAYLVTQDGQPWATTDLRRFLLERLPDYMLPAVFVTVETMPRTPSGKIDRRALPAPTNERPTLEQSYVAPKTELEKVLVDIWSQALELDQVGIDDNFFDLGGNSLLSLQVVTQIQQALNLELLVVKLFQYPTIAELANYLSAGQDAGFRDRYQQRAQRRKTRLAQSSQALTGVAVIGMVGRFPGAATVEELWQNLCQGVESTTFFSQAELDPSIDPVLAGQPNYVRAKGILEDADKFDAAFFGMNPREAEVMDPQQRVFLEMAWAALENAGYESESFTGLIGVYAGMGNNTYLPNNVAPNQAIVSRVGEFQVMTANEKDYLATRVSYKLNLKGPSISIHTACSTSLVAINEAFHSLMNDQCDLALAGGVSITVPQPSGYLYQEGAMFSKDGHCRPFDAQAAGTIFSNGVGVVVLKRLEEALQDGDQIYAVIRGAAINNDGSDKVSFAAPSVEGQAGAIAMAQAYADIDPATISYVETHGTATPLGDPIEIEALTQAFRVRTEAKQFCAIGSVKSNFGHLIAAAGVTGFIKTVLALKHKLLPPSLHFESPNPNIDFANSPFYVNAKLTEWQGTTPRRAGVSSFGVGGTNAHVVLEEAPPIAPSSPSRPCQLLLLSAKTASALNAATVNLHQHLSQHRDINLADVAYTLQVGRRGFNHRRLVVCRDRNDAIQSLETLPPQHAATRQTDSRNPDVIFMFPGQGSQYINMGLNLYEEEPVFRATVDQCATLLLPLLGRDLREVLYPTAGGEEATAEILRNTFFTQPALFTIEYALAQLWRSWGVKPAGMIGHSIGEFVAACLAGVFSLEDALRLVATRGRLMQELPGGSMLSVRQSAADVEPRLSPELAIAAVNAPGLCVVSGPTAAIAQLQQTLEAEEILCKPLHTSHAFHSPMMEPIVAPFAETVRTVQLHPPKLPFVSTVTATWITPDQATDPLYWAHHLRATVRFADGIEALWQQPERVLLEVGPRTTAATMARRQAKNLKQQIVISSLSDTAADQAEWLALLNAVGQLWLAGVAIAWSDFYAHETRHRVPLPTYPFEHKRFWLDPPVRTVEQAIPSVAQSQFIPEPTHLLGASMPQVSAPSAQSSRQQTLIPQLKDILEETSGLELADVDTATSFLEMGLDSLSLTQVGLTLQQQFKVKVTFRQLMESFPTLGTLAEFIDQQMPAEVAPVSPVPQMVPPAATPAVQPPTPADLSVPIAPVASVVATSVAIVPPAPLPLPPISMPTIPQPTVPVGGLEAAVAQQIQMVSQQIQLMNRQLELLAGNALAPHPSIALTASQPTVHPQPVVEQRTDTNNGNGKHTTNGSNGAPAAVTSNVTSAQTNGHHSVKPEEKPKAFGAIARIDTSEHNHLTAQQQQNLAEFIQRYTTRTQQSKQFTQKHRSHLADPRAVSGFNRTMKELVYPIVCAKSFGAKIWDLDGNEYVDLTSGFGSNFFGYAAPLITDAISAQMQKGFEVGPQTPLAGEVTDLVCELTNMERAAFCNTGSEAVLGAMRLARTVTGRKTIAIFSGAYHGIVDEVIVRGTKKLKSLPAAPGIPASAVENLLVVDYDSPESLEILRQRGDELAAIMVEPVQSRRPELQPREFLHQLRHLTQQCGAAFIMDEVITGFRIHPGGAQAHFGVQADIATYGKVVGAGMPIGVIAGKAAFMDALDGGFWQFGDDSFPEVGVTYFAGTFVRHPLTLAAAKAALEYLKQGGAVLQRSLNDKTNQMVIELNAIFAQAGAPYQVNNFGSLFKITYDHELPFGELLFYWLRSKGVHLWDHRPCFLTLAHTDADIEFIISVVKQSVAEMQANGFLAGAAKGEMLVDSPAAGSNQAPVEGAMLGRDPQGNPAWFVQDPNRPGKFLQVHV